MPDVVKRRKYKKLSPGEAGAALPAALPLLGQQLSTIMEHGIERAERDAALSRESWASHWHLYRNPRARLVWLVGSATEIARATDGQAIAILTFENSSEKALLLDSFEAAIVEAATHLHDLPSLLRLGMEAEAHPGDRALAAIRRLVLAGALTLLDGG